MKHQAIIDLLAAGRVANLPSVVSNVVLGCGLGLLTRNFFESDAVFFLPVLAGCLFYLGGCFLNDWKDRDWDAKNRPERALPSGRLSSRLLLTLGTGCSLVGLGLTTLLGHLVFFIGVALLACILIYTWLHKKTAWGVLPMGLARALLYPLGFFSQVPILLSEDIPWLFSAPEVEQILLADKLNQAEVIGVVILGLLSYIAGLSLFARAESQAVVPRTNRVLGLLFLVLPALTHSFHWMPFYPIWNLISLAPFVFFLMLGIRRTRSSVPKGVTTFLASICLLDFIVALPLAVAFLSHETVASTFWQAICFPLVSIAAFLLALLLQRIAPAT